VLGTIDDFAPAWIHVELKHRYQGDPFFHPQVFTVFRDEPPAGWVPPAAWARELAIFREQRARWRADFPTKVAAFYQRWEWNTRPSQKQLVQRWR
jgi:hypothetical protein